MSRSRNNHHSDTGRRFSNSLYDHRIAEQQQADFDEQMAEHHGLRSAPPPRLWSLATVTRSPDHAESDRNGRIIDLQLESLRIREEISWSIFRLNNFDDDILSVRCRHFDRMFEVDDELRAMIRKADDLLQGRHPAPERRHRPWFLTSIAA